MVRTVRIQDLTADDVRFIETATFTANASNLNQTHVDWPVTDGETDNDEILFVVEEEEDNRHMRGGSISEFGKVYGRPLYE